MKKTRNIILLAVCLFIIPLLIFIFFKTTFVSYINVKSIPVNSKTFLIVNNNIIIDEFSDYFIKNPLDGSKFYNFIKSQKLENFSKEIAFKVNEPIACFYEEDLECWNIILAVKNSTLEIENISSEFINPNFKKIKTINDYSLHIFNNSKYNQLILLVGNKNISKDLVYEKTKTYFQNLDTTHHNIEVLNYFKKNKKSIVYKLKNFKFLKDLGVKDLEGTIDFKSDQINFELSGLNEDNFLFNDDYKLITSNYGWANFSGNFNKKVLSVEPFSNLNIDSNFNGRFSLSVHQLKQTSKINTFNSSSQLTDFMDFNLFIGNSRLNKKELKNSFSSYEISLEEDYKGFCISNFKRKHKLKLMNKGFFYFKIDFEKMINQKHSEWAWNGFKIFFKKMNMNNLELKCFSKTKSEFQLTGSLSSLDTTKNLLLSPFIY